MPIFSLVTRVIPFLRWFNAITPLFLRTNPERELPDLWLIAISTPTLDSEVKPFLQKWIDNKFLLLCLWLYCLHRIWNYQSGIDWQYHFRVESADQNSKVFFLRKKYRLLRCSLLSKLDIWKRIVELVHTCSLWLLHILLLDFFHLNTRCRHTRVHLKFTFEKKYNQNFMVCSRKWC